MLACVAGCSLDLEHDTTFASLPHALTHTHALKYILVLKWFAHCWVVVVLVNTFWTQSKEAFPPLLFRRTEPQCITCDGDVLWSSRYYYDNCSHFGAHIAPQSSISSDAGVDYYILECRGPGLPLAGEFFFSSSQFFFVLKRRKISRALENCALESGFFWERLWLCLCVHTIRIRFNHQRLLFLLLSPFFSSSNRCTLSKKSQTY